MNRFLLSVVVGATLFLAGCEKPAPPQAQVHGKITLDKEPLKEGEIQFISPNNMAESLPIKDGAYDGKVTTGERRVRILAYKEVPALPMAGLPDQPTKANYLPARYNTDSDLKKEVKLGETNEFNFDLASN